MFSFISFLVYNYFVLISYSKSVVKYNVVYLQLIGSKGKTKKKKIDLSRYNHAAYITRVYNVNCQQRIL